MKPSGAHTHPSSGSSLPAALAVIAAAAVAVAAAGPVADAIASLLRAVIITGAALIAVAVAALVALAIYRARHSPGLPPHPPWVTGRAGWPHIHETPRRTALGRPNPPVIHLHLHGTSPQDVAEVLARQFLTTEPQDGGDRHATP
jgi:hypothetical protein